MAQFYEMPAATPTMELGTIVEWKIAEGQSFKPQNVIAVVGTDKANMEAEVFDPGVMIKHLVAEGDEVPAGFPIAIIGQSADEDISDLLAKFEDVKATLGSIEAADDDEPETAETEEAPVPTPAPAPTVTLGPVSLDREWMGKTLSTLFADPPGDLGFGRGASATPATGHVVASPLAKKIAKDRGVDLAAVRGSGPGGRIVRADVENAPVGGSVIRALAPRQDDIVRNSPMRKTIAKRLLESHQDIPTFFLTVDFDMSGFVNLRTQLKGLHPDKRLSYNDILVACVARALRESPNVNASWGGKAITRHGRVDIGIAVAVPDGLITPVLRGADTMPLLDIGTQTRELAKRAREQKLQPDEYTGSTFTISNLGMYDIDQFTAIINPPEAAILAVGSIAEVPVVQNGQITVGHRMKCTMTCDHRVIDGATGAEFLKVLRAYVESPALLLV